MHLPVGLRRPTWWWRFWHRSAPGHLRCLECDAALVAPALAGVGRARCGRCGNVFRLPEAAPPGLAGEALQAGGTGAGLGREAGPDSDPASGSAAAQGASARVEGGSATGVLEHFPRQVGAYLLEHEIARGGMAAVYRGRHSRLGTPVAVKLLLPSWAPAGEMGRRLFREALALARFRHPRIVPVLDAGTTPEGIPYLVMELVLGQDLAQCLREQGPLPWRRALGILAQLCEGIDFAHAQGVIHRDLKPGNVLLDRDGQAQLVDFGLARDESAVSALTRTGTALGTPAYMSPEQAQGVPSRIGRRTDLYGLGAILYEMLTGRPPFEGGTPMEVLYRVVHQAPVPPAARVPGLPRSVEAVCLKALEKDPAKRYSSAYQLLGDLRACLEGASPPAAADRLGLRARLRRLGVTRLRLLACGLVALLGLLWLGGAAQREEWRQQRELRTAALVDEGRRLARQGEWERADERLIQALQLAPESAAVYLARRELRQLRREAELAGAEARKREVQDYLKGYAHKLAINPGRLNELVGTFADEILGSLERLRPERSPQAGEEAAAGQVEESATRPDGTPPSAVKVHLAGPFQGRVSVTRLSDEVQQYAGPVPATLDLAPGLYLVLLPAGQGNASRLLLPVPGGRSLEFRLEASGAGAAP